MLFGTPDELVKIFYKLFISLDFGDFLIHFFNRKNAVTAKVWVI